MSVLQYWIRITLIALFSLLVNMILDHWLSIRLGFFQDLVIYFTLFCGLSYLLVWRRAGNLFIK